MMASIDLVSFSRDISFPPPLSTQHPFHTTCLIDIARVKYIMGERQQCHAMDYQQSWFYFFPNVYFLSPLSTQHLYNTTCWIYIMSQKILSGRGNRLTRMASMDLVSVLPDISFSPSLSTQHLFHTTCWIDIVTVKIHGG